MNDRFDLHIITQHHSEVYCGYFRRFVFGNSLTFSHIPLCFHAKPPNFPRLFDPRDTNTVQYILYGPVIVRLKQYHFIFISVHPMTMNMFDVCLLSKNVIV